MIEGVRPLLDDYFQTEEEKEAEVLEEQNAQSTQDLFSEHLSNKWTSS